VGGVNGAATRTAATIRPAAIDVATIAPILLLAVRVGSRWRSLCRVRVIVTASPRASDLASQARTACTRRTKYAGRATSVGSPAASVPLASRPSSRSPSLSVRVARGGLVGLTTFPSGRRLY